jgi:PAS domain S-box-containing protein
MKTFEINERIQKLENIKQLSYELHILLDKESKDGAENLLKSYVTEIKLLENKKLTKLVDSIKNDNSNLEDIIGRVILYTLKYIRKSNEEISSVIKILLIGNIFLLFFGLIVYSREIMHKMEVEKTKNELQQFVNALNSTAIVSKADLKGVITFVNKSFCDVSGYSAEELLGKQHNIIRHPDVEKKVFEDMWKTIKKGKMFKAIIKNRAKSGKAYYVDSVVIPLFDIDGKIEEYMAIRYNVTALVEARDKALVAERSKDEFLSTMSHELRTPLNSIIGFSDILKRSIKDKKYLTYLGNISDSSQSLLSIINDILDLSKLNSGKFELDYHKFNIYNSFKTFLPRFDAQLENSNVKLNKHIDVKNTDIEIIGDWLRISQIVSNFISNAIKFSPKGGDVDITVSYENNNLYISVKDSGIGMSKEAQAKIFKPFEQADTSTTRNYGGTGLGLSIVLNLVQQMDGKIELESQEGKGSEFRVYIPLDKVESNIDKNETEVMINNENDMQDDEYVPLNANILVAEDNKTNQMLIEILLDEYGVEFTIVDDGQEAIKAFKNGDYNLILMDENMPNLNGIEAMKQIRELDGGKDIPIIALTANAMQGDRDKFIDAGMDDFVSKPIDSDLLYETIKNILERKNG